MKEDKNEKLQSRRQFFKKAVKGALPFLGTIALANMPFKALSNVVQTDSECYCYGCTGNCTATCAMNCFANCYTNCSGSCNSTCTGTCVGTCTGTCMGSCMTSCSGTCRGGSYYY